jgi:hypothetical protein
LLQTVSGLLERSLSLNHSNREIRPIPQNIVGLLSWLPEMLLSSCDDTTISEVFLLDNLIVGPA